MIQRIQTLFLVAVIALQVALFYLPLYAIKSADANGMKELAVLRIDRQEIISNPQAEGSTVVKNLLPLILNMAIIAFSAFCIFLFKSRHWQYQLCRFLILVTLGLIVALTLQIEGINSLYPGDTYSSRFYPAFVFPVLSIVFLFLAGYFIRRDEKKVRSSSRIRG